MDLLVASIKWVKTADELRGYLDPRLDTCDKCQGHSKKKPTCGNVISRDSRSKIDAVLDDIVKSGNLEGAAQHLEKLAVLTLCKRWHQYQVAEKVAEWRKRLGSVLGLGDADAGEDEKKTGISQKLSTADPGLSSSLPPTTPMTGITFKIKPSRHQLAQQQSPQALIKKGEDDKLELASVPPSFGVRITRRSASTLKDKTLHAFRNYARHREVNSINENIKRRLHGPFTGNEKPERSGESGFIYGFQLPKNHKLMDGGDCNMVKIGYSKCPNRRMRAWERQCGYTPDLLFARETPHHVKMEDIIHLHLENDRRVEHICPCCGSNHKEFFEVGVARATEVVEMWTEWAKWRPFDETGRLTEYWYRRLKTINLDDPDCWEKFVQNKVKVEVKEESD